MKRVAVLLSLAFVALQLFQPSPPQASFSASLSPIQSHVSVPADVDTLLRAACYDCHSAETNWPWYASVSPMSWMVARDVELGRSNLDFSLWSTDPDVEPTPSQRLRGICYDIREGIMPPRAYEWAHRSARWTAEDAAKVCDWAESAGNSLEEPDVR